MPDPNFWTITGPSEEEIQVEPRETEDPLELAIRGGVRSTRAVGDPLVSLMEDLRKRLPSWRDVKSTFGWVDTAPISYPLEDPRWTQPSIEEEELALGMNTMSNMEYAKALPKLLQARADRLQRHEDAMHPEVAAQEAESTARREANAAESQRGLEELQTKAKAARAEYLAQSNKPTYRADTEAERVARSVRPPEDYSRAHVEEPRVGFGSVEDLRKEAAAKAAQQRAAEKWVSIKNKPIPPSPESLTDDVKPSSFSAEADADVARLRKEAEGLAAPKAAESKATWDSISKSPEGLAEFERLSKEAEGLAAPKTVPTIQKSPDYAPVEREIPGKPGEKPGYGRMSLAGSGLLPANPDEDAKAKALAKFLAKYGTKK